MAIDPQAALADEPLRRYDRFVALVSELASLSLPEAELAVHAVVETMAEHLSDDQRRELASRLPKAVRPWLDQPGDGEQLRHAAFLHRVAEREGISLARHDRVGLKAAERHTRAVFEVVRLVLRPTRSTPSRSGSPRRRASCCVVAASSPPESSLRTPCRACGGGVQL